MTQMYKVFFNNRTLFLVDETEVLSAEPMMIHHYIDTQKLNDFINQFNKDETSQNGAVVLKKGMDGIETIKPLFKFIEAAGGIVENSQGQILVIHRLGCWDLPKGKCEANETPEQSAIREIKEECDIDVDEICHKIIDTYHTYELKGRLVLKKTYWYKMKINSMQNPSPQKEEAIELAVWKDMGDLNEIKKNSYPSILEVLNKEGV